MFDKRKSDPQLGKEISSHLKSLGQETPQLANSLNREEKIERIQKNVREIMETLGLNLADDSLTETPNRVAKMYVDEIFWGLESENFPKCTTIENKMDYDEMVTVREIKVMSNCEHHLVVIDGKATVSYIPKDKVLGLSKINRIVEYFCRRPQVQERLTNQIYHCLVKILETEDIAVLIDAEHYCVKSRGVEDVGSHTFTSKLGGIFKTNPATRAELFAQINHKLR